jgi:hypothetical protein
MEAAAKQCDARIDETNSQNMFRDPNRLARVYAYLARVERLLMAPL